MMDSLRMSVYKSLALVRGRVEHAPRVRGARHAPRYARTLSNDVTAVHVSLDAEEGQRQSELWSSWGEGSRLVILDSPYRMLLEPLLGYIEELAAQRQPGETITIIVPQFVPVRRWHNLLHAQTATFLRLALLFKPGIVITNVPYHLRREEPLRRAGAVPGLDAK